MHTTTTHSPTRTHHLARADHEAALSVSRWRAAKYRWIAALLTVLGGVVGCSPGDKPPDPWDSGRVTPTTVAPEPTASVAATEPTTDPTTEAIQAAIQTLRDYYHTVNQVSALGYTNWEDELPQFWGSPQVSSLYGAIASKARELGEHTEGSLAIEILEVDYALDDESMEPLVVLNYCVDSSGVRVILGDGTEKVRNASRRIAWTAELVIDETNAWRITSLDNDLEAGC